MTESRGQAASAYEGVRRLIVEGRMAPGEPLREQRLAAALGVSRTPIREAVRRLESDGLVESTGRGVIVAGLDPEGLRSAYEVRAALEALTSELAAARQQAGRIAPAELAELERYAEDAERATAAGDLDAAIVHNRRFHRQIAALSGNELAIALLDSLWDQITVSTRTFLATTDSGDDVAEDHRRLMSAIRNGDREGAASAARRHVERTLAMDRAP